jgi:hypothetical protein
VVRELDTGDEIPRIVVAHRCFMKAKARECFAASCFVWCSGAAAGGCAWPWWLVDCAFYVAHGPYVTSVA